MIFRNLFLMSDVFRKTYRRMIREKDKDKKEKDKERAMSAAGA
jgi:hypothetical protein